MIFHFFFTNLLEVVDFLNCTEGSTLFVELRLNMSAVGAMLRSLGSMRQSHVNAHSPKGGTCR